MAKKTKATPGSTQPAVEVDPLAFLDEPSTAAAGTPPILEPPLAESEPTPAAAGSAPPETDDWDLSFIADEAETGAPTPSTASLDLSANEPAHEDMPAVEPESPAQLEFAAPAQEMLPNLDFDVEKVPSGPPASVAETTLPATPPATPRSRAHELFSDNGGAPDEGLTAVARSDILDDLAQLMPLGDDRSDDKIETEPVHSSRDIFAPILENLMSEEELSRRLGDEPHPLAPRDAAEQARIDALIPREYNTPGVVVHEIEDRPERSTALDVKRVRFPLWNKFWNGWLGWEGLETHPSEWFVIGKLSARFALFGLLPVLLVVAISLPFSGYLYAHTSADYNRSSLLYSRPVVDLALPDTTVQTTNGQPVSGRLLGQLSGLYDAYYTDIPSAFISGDPTPLQSVLSSDIYATYAAQVSTAHANKWTITFFGVGQFGQYLGFDSVFPTSGPQQVMASTGPLTVVVADSSGAEINTSYYGTINVSFYLTSSGWRINSLVMTPLPTASAEPSASAAPSASASPSTLKGAPLLGPTIKP